mmetsp:Transcript_7374/g.22147  ORF Transcript_7374/g.22147 Transcript_7374/m.22147 type:complete len:413 (+) Transcript_7374:1637-2875(+)
MTSKTGRFDPPSRRSRSATGLARIESSGTKVSGAHFCALRYFMHSMATDSSSTTIASIDFPIAIVTAALYRRCVGLQMSIIRPCTPGISRLRFSRASADLRSRSVSRCSAFDEDRAAASLESSSRSSPWRTRVRVPADSACSSCDASWDSSTSSCSIRASTACLRSDNAESLLSSAARCVAYSSSRVRPCMMMGSSDLISRVFAWMTSCSAAVLAPASALSRLYSSRCRLPISSSPRSSASFCSFIALASASDISASWRSSALICLELALYVSSVFSRDLACAARRRSMCLISSRSLIAAGFWPSTCCCSADKLLSSSTALRVRRALSFSTKRIDASAFACASATPPSASFSALNSSRSFTISRSVTYRRCKYCSFCSCCLRSSRRWYASASSFCFFMMAFSCARPFFFWWL